MIPGYEIIQELAQNDGQTLYRGRRLADQCPVLLKLPHRDVPNAADLELLKREAALLQTLDLPGVPAVIELLQYHNRYALVLADHGGMPLFAARGLALNYFFKIALQLVSLLAELHRRELIHQNINPRSILVHPATDAVTLTDFSMALRVAAEMPTTNQTPLRRGALAYLAPEQTGRINCATDYRADFYALGVTFYELLTGRLPFFSDDALELIHWHIAKPPLAPSEIKPEIPVALSQIILKLLAKTADERYQSALGLRADLAHCAREWTAHGYIEPFELGQHDVSDRFLIPQKLYGRTRQVEQMLGAFKQVCQGAASTLLLVAGYAGIGKTALIRALDTPIVRQRGYFIAGKFDQVARGVPFGALIQALRGLVRQLLSENEEQLALWRERLTTALGANGGVLAEVMPEIELIIGKQVEPPALGSTETLNRFQLVFQNFVGALARPEHPLVILLDDLQWADAATLSLLPPLLTTRDIPCLLLIGAYRDNEVDASHPLARTLAALSDVGGQVQTVTLGPLQVADLTQLIGAALHCPAAEAAPLAQLVADKTAGNPFFVTQFLKALRQDGFLTFDYAQGRWQYDLLRIAAAPLTDNVIDLMTRKLQSLPADTQHALKLAACIGNSFDLQTLTVISGQTANASGPALPAALQDALRAGLLVPATNEPEQAAHNQSFTFLHDRVQQAAYALIPAEQKQPVHLSIGRLLRQRAALTQNDEQLFKIIQHLNLGSSLISDEAERLALAQLNLNAGRKAKASAAHDAALGYYEAGLRLLNENHWESNYELIFALQLETAECQRLCGQFAAAEAQCINLLGRAQTTLDLARVYNLLIVQYEARSQYAEALAGARACLALFGFAFPEADAAQEAALELEVATIQTLRGERPIATLVDLPVMTDPAMRMAMNILTTIWSSAYIAGHATLTRLFSATLVRLSLEHGNTEESAYGYATHTVTVGALRGDYAAAYEFGKLALAVNARFDDRRLRAKIYQQFHAHANFWRQPWSTCLPYAREASRSGFESGDFTYGIYGAFTETWAAFAATPDLAQFVRDYTPNLALFDKLKVASVGEAQQVLLNWARALMGETSAPASLSDAAFEEQTYADKYRGNAFFAIIYHLSKLQLACHFAEPAAALAAARAAQQLTPQLLGMLWPLLLDFWVSLAQAANFANVTAVEQQAFRQEITAAQARLARLAEFCPENFRCHALLLAAELDRLAGRELMALERYERAASYASAMGLLQQQALANELCAKLWLARGQQQTAAAFMTAAHAAYAQWGATAKAAALEREHPELLGAFQNAPAAELAHSPSTIATATPLDLASVMKAAQTIAGEMELSKLLAMLLRFALENACAERGALILEHAGAPQLHAIGTLANTVINISDAVPLTHEQNLPLSIINYVRHTAESLVLAEARHDSNYAADPFVQQQQTRSLLCTPVLSQGQLIGVLYLENNQASGVFTPARLQIMQVLAAQAAISLENARLFAEMQRAAEARLQTEQTLRSILEGTAALTGDNFFASLVSHLATAIPVKIAFVTECVNPERTRAHTLAFWDGKGLVGDFEYDVRQTTCEQVYAGETCFYARELQKLFPEETALVELNGQSYIGIPVYDSLANLIGHLAVIDDQPMDTPRGMDILKIFAARAGAELERMKAEVGLRQALTEIEQLKNQLHAENLYLQEEIRREHNFEEIVGSSPALLTTLHQVEQVAPTDSTVIIYGETGTGKELIARALHDRSARRQRPLVKVNCGAISAGLVESELFGHFKGAFTGAIDRRVGRFELADGGTLFLDEVGELPLDTQVKLLRVLQEGEFEPVGSSKTVRVNVRIIAATNRKLEDEVRAGRFRADLFYRLNVLPLSMPPLRERQADIPQLAAFFLARFAKQFGKPMEGIAHETMQLLCAYAWPGNIRELQNLIERGVVLANGSVLTLEPQLLPGTMQVEHRAITPAFVPAMPILPAPKPINTSTATPNAGSLADMQRQHIQAVLQQTGGVIEGPNGAALILNLHPNTLRSRMKKLGIQRT